MAACLGTLLASECLSELMPRLTDLPDTDQQWLRDGLVQICTKQTCRRSCQHWQGVSGGTSLTLSHRVLRPLLLWSLLNP